jgi:hypothetical protein
MKVYKEKERIKYFKNLTKEELLDTGIELATIDFISRALYDIEEYDIFTSKKEYKKFLNFLYHCCFNFTSPLYQTLFSYYMFLKENEDKKWEHTSEVSYELLKKFRKLSKNKYNQEDRNKLFYSILNIKNEKDFLNYYSFFNKIIRYIKKLFKK